MHTNSQKSRWKIPSTQLPVLKEALQSDVEQTRARGDQRRLVREICSLPEVRALPPEQFFIAFKQAVNDAATELGLPRSPEREQLVSRLLTVSIEEFFHPDGDGDGRSAQASSWSERLGLSLKRHHLNGGAHQSKDEECRGIRPFPNPALHRGH
jgi:hypothetical protein